MDAFLLSANAVLPLLLCMAAGYVIRGIGMLSEGTLQQLNNLVFRVFLPILLFKNVYSTDLATAFDGKLLLVGVLFVFAMFFLLLLVVPLFEKDNRRKGVVIQGVYRSNYALFGIPIVSALFGAVAVGTISVSVAVIVPLFNALAVVVLESFQPTRKHPLQIALGILKNPIIIGSAAGMLLLVLQVPLPSFLDKAVGDLAGVTTPFALLVLGASFRFEDVTSRIRPLAAAVFGKLVLCPLVFLPIAVLVGLRGCPSCRSPACWAHRRRCPPTRWLSPPVRTDSLPMPLLCFPAFFPSSPCF